MDNHNLLLNRFISIYRLDMPELLWKSYIDFEISQDETENARQLFERLLERTLHVKVRVVVKYEIRNIK